MHLLQYLRPHSRGMNSLNRRLRLFSVLAGEQFSYFEDTEGGVKDACLWTHLCVHECGHACGSWGQTETLLSVLIFCPTLLTHSLLLKLELFLSVPAPELPESALTAPSAGVINTHVHVRLFVMSAGDLNSGLQILIQWVLLSKKNLPSPILNLITSYNVFKMKY